MNQLKTESLSERKNSKPGLTLNPYLEVVLAIMIMGSSGVFIKFLELPSIVLASFRVAIPTLLLFIYFRLKKVKLFHRPVKWMLLGSLLNAIRIYFFMNSYAYTGIANAVIILYSWPIFASIFSMLFLREKIPGRNIFLLLLPFAGIIIIFSSHPFSLENNDFIGMSSMLLSAIIYALSVIVFKKESDRFSGYETVFFQNLAGSILFTPFLFLVDFELTAGKAGLLLLFSTSIGVIAFGLFFSALRKIKASTVSFLSYLEVIIATTYGVLIFDEKITWQLITGGILIIVSTILLKKQ